MTPPLDDPTAGDDTPAPEAVVAAFGLPGPVVAMRAVGGAWSNRVYCLETPAGRFAVKQLDNPWSEPHWQDRLLEAWEFEQRGLAAGVSAPEPVPNPANGGCIAHVSCISGAGTAAVRVHRWVDGTPCGPAPVTQDVATWAGRLLAVLHGLQVKPADRGVFPAPGTDSADRWGNLIEAADRAGARWASQLASAAGSVATVAELALAGGHQPDREVMRHGDIDQKNLVLSSTGPVLCDWDVAAPLDPRRELADVALSLGGWRRFDVSQTVVRAYRMAGGEVESMDPSDLGQTMMRSVDWLVLNIECACRLRAVPPARAELADRLVPELLSHLRTEVEVALSVQEVLPS